MDRLNEIGYIKILHNKLSKDFCERLIDYANKKNWNPALINNGGKQEFYPEIRKCSRVMAFNKSIVEIIWNNVKHDVMLFKRDLLKECSINPMLRFLRYENGEYFRSHYDGEYKDDDGNVSLLTVQIYLNDDFEGGHIIFYDPEHEDEVLYTHKPSIGDIILFEQSAFLHSGGEVKSGTKYCVRTEIMYPNLSEE